MTGRERVLQAIEFRSPERLPLAKGPDSDIGYVGCKPARDFVPGEPGADEWRCVRVSLRPEKGDQGQVRGHPLADWDRAQDYGFPDPHAMGRFTHAAAGVAAGRAHGLFILGELGKGPMHRLDDLRGFEAYLEDLLLAPERIEFILDGTFRFLTGLVEEYGLLGVDGVFLIDDQAMQTGPVFSMGL